MDNKVRSCNTNMFEHMFYHSLLSCEFITNRNMFHNNTYNLRINNYCIM
jgi:hypothetical protein